LGHLDYFLIIFERIMQPSIAGSKKRKTRAGGVKKRKKTPKKSKVAIASKVTLPRSPFVDTEASSSSPQVSGPSNAPGSTLSEPRFRLADEK